MGSERIIHAPPGKGVDPNHPAGVVPEIFDHDECRIDWKGRDKLAIVGFATSTREMAPFDDPEYVILGLNQLYRHIPRADAWIEIHVNWYEHCVENTDHEGWLREFPGPVFMKDRVEGIPNSVRFPIERAIATFSDYFTSTIAFGVALGIMEGFKTIALYGVDLIVGEEYDYQKACVEYLIGYGNAKGIDMQIPRASALCKTVYRYGYEIEPNWGPMKHSAIMTRLDQLKTEHRTALARAHWLTGRKQEVEDLDGSIDPEVRKARLEELSNTRDQHLADLHMLEGAARECDRWREFLELHKRAGTVPP